MALEMNDLFCGERPELSWIVNGSSRRMEPAYYSSDYNSSRTSHDVYQPYSNNTSRHVRIPVVELMVPICCTKCEEKLREEIFELEGVHRVICDPITHKVIVTGFVDPLRVLKKAKHVKSRSQFWAASTSTVNATGRRDYGDWISTEKPESRPYRQHDSNFRTAYSRYPSPREYGTVYGQHPSPSEYGAAPYHAQYPSTSEYYGTAYGQYPASPRRGREHGFEYNPSTEIMRHYSPYRYNSEFRTAYTHEYPATSHGSYLDSRSYQYAPAYTRPYSTSDHADVITNPNYLKHIESEY